MAAGILSAIHIHPVKSCHRIEVDAVEVTATGLAHDRAWQVVDAEGNCVSQRQQRVMATVQPSISAGRVSLSTGSHGSVELRRDGGPVKVTSLVGVSVDAFDGGDEAAEWISDLLGGSHRLAGLRPDSDNRAHPKLDRWGQPITFVDLAPVLVANMASLRWLQERANEPFGMERFRPNLIVETDTPWAEDTWGELRIGDAEVRAEFPWPRCAVPQIDQESGERQREPAVVLKAHRWIDEAPGVEAAFRPIIEGNALFGVGCAIGPAGTTLRVGDSVTVLSTHEPLLPAPA